MLLVGTSGWSYQDWVGPVYPPELKDEPGLWLQHYAQRFPTVEVNSTFYRLPGERTVQGWVAKAEKLGGPFEFSIKAPQDLSHTAMVQGDAQMAGELCEQFKDLVLQPLAEARALGAVLLQLSPRFQGGEGELRMLDLTLAALKGPDIAVEFRHRTWVEGRELVPGAEDVLKQHGASLVAVDGPSFPPMLRSFGQHAYVRFHGRRPDVWFAKGAARRTEDDLPARYDYLYTEAELQPWARVLADNEPAYSKVRVFFNNHPRGQAVVNAEQMMGLLHVPKPARAPVKPSPQRKLEL